MCAAKYAQQIKLGFKKEKKTVQSKYNHTAKYFLQNSKFSKIANKSLHIYFS